MVTKPDSPPARNGRAPRAGPLSCDKDLVPETFGEIFEPYGRGIALTGLFESPICDSHALALFGQEASEFHSARLIALQAGGAEVGPVATDITIHQIRS